MKYYVTIRGKEVGVEVDGERVTIDGEMVLAHLVPVPGTPLWHLRIGAESHALVMRRGERGEWHVWEAGSTDLAEVVDERTRHIRSLTGDTGGNAGPPHLKAPMPGLVVRVTVTDGQLVQAGEGLIVLEAMKMENELRSPAAGTVAAIRVVPGQAVEKGQVLIEFAPVAPGGPHP